MSLQTVTANIKKNIFHHQHITQDREKKIHIKKKKLPVLLGGTISTRKMEREDTGIISKRARGGHRPQLSLNISHGELILVPRRMRREKKGDHKINWK